MRSIKTFLLFTLIVVGSHAHASQYVIIKMGYWGNYKLVYVDKPKNLAHWHYDIGRDIYYHARNFYGIPLPVYTRKKATSTLYVTIKPGFWWGVKLLYTDNPKNPNDWIYDDHTGTYYRGKSGWGWPTAVAIVK